MKQALTVARFTFKEAVRKKAFWVTNIIYIVFVIAAVFLLPMLDGATGGMDIDITAHPGTYRGALAFLLDESQSPMLAGLSEAIENTGMEVIMISAEQLDATLDRVREHDNAAVVHISEEEGMHANIIMRDIMSATRFPASAVGEIINDVYRWNQFDQFLDSEDMTQVEIVMESQVHVGSTQLQDFTNMVAAMALMTVMFMSVYAYGSSVAMSVATEKSTRVMETLIVSARPSRILVGKCVGMGLVGLVQMVGILSLAGILGLLRTMALAPMMQDMAATESTSMTIPLPVAGMLLLYFLMGYALFAMINSMCGAMVSKVEDLNSALLPVSLIAVGSFYVGGLGPMLMGGGDVGRGLMLVPFTSAFAAPSVLLSGDFDWGLIALSVAIMLASIALLSWISGKVYSASVLHYGSRLKLSDLGKLMKK